MGLRSALDAASMRLRALRHPTGDERMKVKTQIKAGNGFNTSNGL